MPSSWFLTERWAAHIAATGDPDTRGHLLLSLQPPADPHEVLGLESTRFLLPRREHWGGFVMDRWELGWFFLIIILFVPGCETMKNSAVVDVWWVPVEVCCLLGNMSSPVSCNCRWQCLTYGAVWRMLWRTERKRSTNICREVEQILLQMKESMAWFIDHTQCVYSFSRIHFGLHSEPTDIDEDVFSLPLDEPCYWLISVISVILYKG